MRIAVDARELGDRPTGVGRYLAELIARWTRSARARPHELVLYTDRLPPYRDALVGLGGAQVRWTRLAAATNLVWEQHHLRRAVRQDAPDVLFCPAYASPIAAPAPVVLTLHDISFVAHPEWFGWREGLRRRLSARLGAWSARRIITLSGFSAQEITERLGVPRARVAAIPIAVDHQVGISPAGAARREADAPAGRDPLVLYVGSIFNRRHVPVLIEAFTRLLARRPDARLALVGEDRTHPPERIASVIAASPGASRIAWRPYVDDHELSALYGRAAVFVFLSTYEGFGLTPLEALSAGIPIVVADTPVAHEVYGGAAAFVEAGSAAAVASQIDELMDPGGVRRTALLDRAPSVLGRYSWDRTAEATLTVLEEAAG